jgi:DNA-binding response OmpR family regulator
MLPGLDGVGVLKKLRDIGSGIPVLMVTALDGIGDRVTGLDAGADDYLVKPFAVEELLARVRSLGRRPVSWEADPSVSWGDLSLDVQRHRLTRQGKSLTLTKREAQLLETFLQHPEAVMTRAVLFARVWGPDAPVEDGNLDNYIHFLRKRLTELGSGVQIRTVRSVGYTLC